MSALEIYLKHAAEMKGTWHKGEIRNIRLYMYNERKEDIIAAIKLIRDQALLRLLWEVGLDTELQQVVTYQSKRIAEEEAGVK